jgi:hypothetical protein
VAGKSAIWGMIPKKLARGLDPRVRGSVSYFDLLTPNLAIKLLPRLRADDGSR